METTVKLDVHEFLLAAVDAGLNHRVERGVDLVKLTQMQLSCLAGVGQGNLSAIYHGKPACEATWQKLLDAAWDDGLA